MPIFGFDFVAILAKLEHLKKSALEFFLDI